MAYLYTLALLKVLLPVTWFTVMGLLALWAASPSRHWFLRAMAVWAALTAWLTIPAYEPIIVFGSEMIFVAIGIFGYRKRQKRLLPDSELRSASERQCDDQRLRFSLQTAFLLCALVAVFTFLAVQIPRNVWTHSACLILGGAILATITLLAAWLVHGKSDKSKKAIVGVSILVTLPLAFAALGEPNIYPFVGNNLHIVLILGVGDPTFSFLIFYVSMIGALALLMVGLVLLKGTLNWRGNGADPTQRDNRRFLQHLRGPAIAPAVAVLLAFVVIPPALTVWDLSRPLASIDDPLPTPNGRDALVALGGPFPPRGFDARLAARETFARVCRAAASAKDAFRDAHAIRVGVGDRQSEIRRIHSTEPRSLALQAKAKAALSDGNVDESLQCCFDLLDLAQSMQHSGLVFDYQSAFEMEFLGTRGIYNAIDKMDANQRQSAIARLADFDAKRVDIEVPISRQRNWEMKSHTWAGRLNLRVLELAQVGDDYWEQRRLRTILVPLKQAIARLLIVELAVREYQLDHGKLPAELADLIPKYLPSLPTDPFARGNQPLDYVPTDDRYSLSSVGPAPPSGDGFEARTLFPPQGDAPPGQIRLDTYFHPPSRK